MTYGKDTGYSYAGRLPCGCIVSAHVDAQDNNTGNAVKEMILDGLIIERVKHEDVHFTMCPKCAEWAEKREATR